MERDKKELLIIIPAYNEEMNIGQVLEQLKAQPIARIADILVMNDASWDRTEEIARSEGVRCITHVFNLGYGSGLQGGYKYAVEHGYQYAIQLDADGQHDVCNVQELYDHLRQPGPDGRCPDIVLGSRFLPGSGSFPIGRLKKDRHPLFSRTDLAHRTPSDHGPDHGPAGPEPENDGILCGISAFR